MSNKAKILALAGVLPLGIPNAPASSGENDAAQALVSPSAQKVTTNCGSLSYSFGKNGVAYEGGLSGVRTSQLMPKMYDNSDGSIGCGPLSSYDEGALLQWSEGQLQQVVTEEVIARHLKQSKVKLSQEEQAFLSAHQQDMKAWGLRSTVSPEGNMTLSQDDPMNSGKISITLNNYAHPLTFQRGTSR